MNILITVTLGMFNCGKQTGYGVQKWFRGRHESGLYRGQFVDGEKTGPGIEEYHNGNIYEVLLHNNDL